MDAEFDLNFMPTLKDRDYTNYYKDATDAEKEEFRVWLVKMLHFGPVNVVFVKKDGTERSMNCTLDSNVAIPHEKTTDKIKEQNLDVCPVWDIDKGAWRSFRYDCIRKVNFDL